jgi:5-methylthioadenosine/S-adenosylhomocysteine deaminase
MGCGLRAAREFEMLAKNGDGFLRPGVSVIHGAAFSAADFKEMAKAGVGLVWSPRNIELYGATSDVFSAKGSGVKIALAPDWSPTGSDGMMEELKYASTWNAAQYPTVFENAELVKMATVVPAQLAGVDKQIGTLAKGMYADPILIRRNASDAYQALLHASPTDFRLVVIGGVPTYGDPDLMDKLLPQHELERLTSAERRRNSISSHSKEFRKPRRRSSRFPVNSSRNCRNGVLRWRNSRPARALI